MVVSSTTHNISFKVYNSRELLLKLNAMPTLLKLVESSSSDIQQCVVKILTLATKDDSIRSYLAQSSTFGNLLRLLTNENMTHLHEQLLLVIANLMEDTIGVEVLLQTGGLAQLIKCLTTAKDSPVDEARTSASRQSRRQKPPATPSTPLPSMASAKRTSRRSKSVKSVNKKSHIPDESKIHAFRAILRAGRNDTARQAMRECKIGQLIQSMLLNQQTYVEDLQLEAVLVETIAVLATDMLLQAEFCTNGCFERIFELLRLSQGDCRTASLTALANLTSSNGQACRLLASLDPQLEVILVCTQPQVDLENCQHERLVAVGLTLIANMTSTDSLNDVQRQLTVKHILPLLDSSFENVRLLCVTAVSLLVECEQTRMDEFVDNSERLTSLMTLLEDPNREVRRVACRAIYHLAGDNKLAQDINNNGGLEKLFNIDSCNTDRDRYSELAYNRLLDVDLTAKFALKGYLDFEDKIGDLFFDLGPITHPGQVKQLDTYRNQSPDHQRPIYVFDTRSSTVENTDQSLDQSLLEWIDHVVEEIKPLTDLKQRASKLARFVVSQYGGRIEKAAIHSFDYITPLSTLRCTLNSNLIPMGRVTKGVSIHRALLFKIDEQDYTEFDTTIVNLLNNPGQILIRNSQELEDYLENIH